VAENRTPTGILTLDVEVTEHNNVYAEPHSNRFSKLKPLLNLPASDQNVLYFVGCTTAYRHPEIALATNDVLTSLGITPHFLTGDLGEVCCGSPLMRAGFMKTAKKLAEQNVAAITQAGIQTVLTTCPGCARALRQDYPKLGIPLPKKVQVLHITEYLMKHRKRLSGLVHNPWLHQADGSKPVLGYHDPCHLGRELGVYEPPRRLLKLIPRTDLIEFQHNRDHADCCGGGGALPKTFPLLAKAITQTRLQNASQLHLDILISACPNCKLHFTQLQSQVPDAPHQILDIVQVLAKAIKAGK
jgi:heterodisulfide reductase subunit D